MPVDVEQANTAICTTCGAKYLGRTGSCYVDGTTLRVGGSVTHLDLRTAAKVCGNCSATYPKYAQYCPDDGVKLDMIRSGSTQPSVVHYESQAIMRADPAQYASVDPVPQRQSPAAEPAIANNLSIGVASATGQSLGLDLSRTEEERLIGATFAGKWKIESLLGEGGMARVYLARHMEIEKPVVIKLMNNNMSAKERDTSFKRFVLETKVTARLNHPNLVTVFDGGDIDGPVPYLVMEYIQGESLRNKLNMVGSLHPHEAITIISQVCLGLYEAHAEGIVHRDLKPENIMLRAQSDRPDWVKVVDFGIAHLKQGGHKLTATGIAVGTVDYMSPEYLRDEPIDHRADIYAVGIMLFELLTGHCPFEADTCEAILAKHLFSFPPTLSSKCVGIAPGNKLDAIVERALAKQPEDRYQSVRDMNRDLKEALNDPLISD